MFRKGLALALKVPFVLIVTKIDIGSREKEKERLNKRM